MAVRVPLTNASLTDCVFELDKSVTKDEVNQALMEAANTRLQGVLGYEEKPLVSVDYLNDTRSSIVDGLSTMIINNTQLKLFLWYDNEIGYVNRNHSKLLGIHPDRWRPANVGGVVFSSTGL